jgi:hypothetical protein
MVPGSCRGVARRITLLGDPTTISTRAQLARAAGEPNVEPVPFKAGSSDELGRALDAIGVANVGAAWLRRSCKRLASRFLAECVITAYQRSKWPESAGDGGLLRASSQVGSFVLVKRS